MSIPPNAAVLITSPTITTRRNDHWFYRCMILAMLAICVAGFLPGIVNSRSRLAPVTPLVVVHGIVFLSWLLLFFAQTTLISTGQISVHRRLGILGAFLAAAMLGLGYATTIAMGRRGFDLSGDLNAAADPLGSMVFPLFDLLTFGVLIAAGIWYRRRGKIHKRLMLLATVAALMPSPLAHVIGHNALLRPHPGIIVIPLALLYLASIIYDRISLGRFHPVSLWGGVVLFAWGNIRAAVIGPSVAWHHFAAWLIK